MAEQKKIVGFTKRELAAKPVGWCKRNGLKLRSPTTNRTIPQSEIVEAGRSSPKKRLLSNLQSRVKRQPKYPEFCNLWNHRHQLRHAEPQLSRSELFEV